ncbi:hypothetical protein F3Y22_tig00110813pilonHSYRG00207 [Hibiscus syriacus]|uniref:Uncharacterized protein n=1 Tax=Hibiscus syriacus TaxID=106335 RepID=A0A6A2ZMU5_HIBSY|nr:hypothetical protein F3Y22_tig00110813pilonHSYRG00207 [Hibiscus syriacus]
MCNNFNAIMGRHSSATPYDMYRGGSTNNLYGNIASSSRGMHSSANPFDLNMDMPSTSRGRRESSRFFDLNMESMEEPSSPPEELLREPGADGAETGLFIHPKSPQFNSNDDDDVDEVPTNVAQTDPPAQMYEADYGAMYRPEFANMPHLGDYGYYSSVNNAIQLQYGYTVSYKKAWLAKQNAIVKLHGEWDASYNELPGWCGVPKVGVNGRVVKMLSASEVVKRKAPANGKVEKVNGVKQVINGVSIVRRNISQSLVQKPITILGASVGFRVGGWKCLTDVVVKFNKGAVESVIVGEIKL